METIFLDDIPRMPVWAARGVLSPSSACELASPMRTSGVSAPRCTLVGDEDWKNMGEDDGTFPSAARRLAARGVAWRVGLLGGSRADRADEAGDAVDCLEARVLRLAGEDMLWMWEEWGGRMSGAVGGVEEIQRRESKSSAGTR